jgi:hypothetical protein
MSSSNIKVIRSRGMRWAMHVWMRREMYARLAYLKSPLNTYTYVEN